MENKNYLEFANSWQMFTLSAVVITFVIIQSILFYKRAYNRGLDIGINKVDLKRITKSAGIFAIVPALPILIFLLMLSPSLGKFFPWLRLSVIGSGVYENMVANQVATNLGAPGFEGLTMDDFMIVMLTMTFAIVGGLTASIFFLKPLSKKIVSLEQSTNGFGPHLVPAMFIGLVVSMAYPYLLPKINHETDTFNINLVSALVVIIGGLSFLALNYFSKKYNSRALSEFAFPVSILIGMAAAIVLTQLGLGMVQL